MPFSAVERAVKLVTDSILNVCGSFAREGYTSEQNPTAWKNVPKFNTKKWFNALNIVKKSQQMLSSLKTLETSKNVSLLSI